jgi:hypothetical protein
MNLCGSNYSVHNFSIYFMEDSHFRETNSRQVNQEILHLSWNLAVNDDFENLPLTFFLQQSYPFDM